MRLWQLPLLVLQALKDLERAALLWASLTMGVPSAFPQVGPRQVLGVELTFDDSVDLPR
ncbi:MAG: hypothetical protein M5U22_02405 [Thermoleophilia bacterium]|nr:hypothetical protein [Thermoleophilia bacterium]